MSEKGNEMLITEAGCIVHKNVEFKEDRRGISVWVCIDCKQEFAQYEDSHGG